MRSKFVTVVIVAMIFFACTGTTVVAYNSNNTNPVIIDSLTSESNSKNIESGIWDILYETSEDVIGKDDYLPVQLCDENQSSITNEKDNKNESDMIYIGIINESSFKLTQENIQGTNQYQFQIASSIADSENSLYILLDSMNSSIDGDFAFKLWNEKIKNDEVMVNSGHKVVLKMNPDAAGVWCLETSYLSNDSVSQKYNLEIGYSKIISKPSITAQQTVTTDSFDSFSPIGTISSYNTELPTQTTQGTGRYRFTIDNSALNGNYYLYINLDDADWLVAGELFTFSIWNSDKKLDLANDRRDGGGGYAVSFKLDPDDVGEWYIETEYPIKGRNLIGTESDGTYNLDISVTDGLSDNVGSRDLTPDIERSAATNRAKLTFSGCIAGDGKVTYSFRVPIDADIVTIAPYFTVYGDYFENQNYKYTIRQWKENTGSPILTYEDIVDCSILNADLGGVLSHQDVIRNCTGKEGWWTVTFEQDIPDVDARGETDVAGKPVYIYFGIYVVYTQNNILASEQPDGINIGWQAYDVKPITVAVSIPKPSGGDILYREGDYFLGIATLMGPKETTVSGQDTAEDYILIFVNDFTASRCPYYDRLLNGLNCVFVSDGFETNDVTHIATNFDAYDIADSTASRVIETITLAAIGAYFGSLAGLFIGIAHILIGNYSDNPDTWIEDTDEMKVWEREYKVFPKDALKLALSFSRIQLRLAYTFNQSVADEEKIMDIPARSRFEFFLASCPGTIRYVTTVDFKIPVNHPFGEPLYTPLDLCMVLDRSGSMDESMGDKKKIQGAKEAAADVVDVLFPQDRISLISFSSTATTDIDFTSDFSAVKTEINQLSAFGGTSFGAGLQAALNQFNATGNPDHIPAILFMSDGVHNRAPAPDAFVTECKNKGIPIYTVGFASSESEVDATKLKDMADETGGEYLFADDIFELQNIFIGLQHKASGWESEATYTGEVNQGQTVTAGSFDIAPSTKNSRVTLNWPGSDLDLKLLNPDGIPVNFSAPDIIYSGDTKPEYVILKEPQPGTWTVRVYGKVVDSSEDYYVLVTEYVPPGSQICKTQITSDPSLQDRPSIVNANGDYYVAYQSWETGSSYNGDIFIKKYDSKWNEVKKQQITDNSYYQDSPSLVFANNELYVALITNHEGATWDDYDVYLKKYDSNLNYISSSGRYLTTSQSCQDLPSLFYKDGYFYLTYSSWESGSSYNGDIYIKKFDSSWNQIKKVRITSETSLQTRPSVIYANGYFYIVYYSKETGNRDIFVKRLDANLNLDSWKKQITSESSSQSFPSISFANNEYAIVYASYETGTIGIYMKKYDINWNFIEKTKLVDESSAQERRPSHIWDGSNYLVSYVHNYTANDDWNIFTMIPGCNEGQLSQTIPLQVSVSETPDSVTSGETSQVTVHVTSSADGLPVQGASVMVSVIGGSVTPTSGTTDGNGDIKLTYHAPTVTSPTICLISATTSKTGYTSGSGSDMIVVNPQGGQTTYSIPLHTGWNLISIPLVPEDSNIDSVFSSIAGNYGVVWTTTSTGGWKSSNQAFGRLTDITVDKGYLIYMTAPDTLVIEGTEPASTIINLASGWNLVGYPSQTTRSITDVLSGVSYGVVWTTTSTGGWKSSNQAFGRLTDMSPGNGYMLYAPVSGSYTVN